MVGFLVDEKFGTASKLRHVESGGRVWDSGHAAPKQPKPAATEPGSYKDSKRAKSNSEVPSEKPSERAPTPREEYASELFELSKKDLLARFDEVVTKKNAMQQGAELSRKLAHKEQREKFYSRPESQADFKIWSQKEIWTLDEAVALLLGKNPRVVTWSVVQADIGVIQFVKEFAELKDTVSRASPAGTFGDQGREGFSPREFLEWVRTKSIEIPAALWDAVHSSELDVEPRASPDEKPVHHRERPSLHKMIYVLAARGKESVDTDETTFVNRVVDWAKLCGFKLDDQTVRRRWHEAVKTAEAERKKNSEKEK
jgi:hypothetical protein